VTCPPWSSTHNVRAFPGALQRNRFFGKTHAGDLYVFRGRKGDFLKVLWHDGLRLSLYAKRLERGRFVWPSPADGVVSFGSSAWLLARRDRWVRRETGMRQRVEVPYDEDLANHIVPESCGRHREVSFEALTGVLVGQLLSDETLPFRSADAFQSVEGHTRQHAIASAAAAPRRLKNLACQYVLCSGTERSPFRQPSAGWMAA
jgi:hypothetical protein